MKEDGLAIKVESYRDLPGAIQVFRSRIRAPVAELVQALKSGGELLLADDWFVMETDEQEQWLQFLFRLKAAGVTFAVLLPDEGAVDLAFLSKLVELHRQIDLDGQMQKQLELGEWSPELAEWVRQQSAPVLMILENEKEMIPTTPLAFRAARSSERRLRKTYEGALILSAEGDATRIQTIEVKGLRGESIGRKLVSALSGARAIEVTFGAPLEITLDEMKDLVIRHLPYDQERPDPYFELGEPLETVVERLKAAGSVEEVFRLINIPGPEDCLDVL